MPPKILPVVKCRKTHMIYTKKWPQKRLNLSNKQIFYITCKILILKARQI